MKKLVLFLLIAVSVCNTAYGQGSFIAKVAQKVNKGISPRPWKVRPRPWYPYRFDPISGYLQISESLATPNKPLSSITIPEPILPRGLRLPDNGTFFEHNRLTKFGAQQRNKLISLESMSMDRGGVVGDLEHNRNRLTELGTQLRNELISPVSTDMPRGFVVEEHSVAPPSQSPTNAEPATGKATGWRDGLNDAILQKLHKINPQKTKGGLYMIEGYILFKDYEEYYRNNAA